MKKQKGILVVSFGTSYHDTRKKTIEAIEKEIQNAFRDYEIYGAFTSQVIKKKLEAQGIGVYNVQEALHAMEEAGITDTIILQPTHMINGIENDLMLETALEVKHKFSKVIYGDPLLTEPEDYKELAGILHEEYPVKEDEVLVLMGHGSEHHANAAYPALGYVLQNCGYENMLVGTVEGYPGLDEVKKQLHKMGKHKVCLAPMMIVAGEHAHKDMIGNENSWKTELEREGFQVRYHLKGLGEIEAVRQMFVNHVKAAIGEETEDKKGTDETVCESCESSGK